MSTTAERIDVETFRAEAKTWLADNAPERGASAATAEMGSDQERRNIERSREFQAAMYDAGFAGITVPTEYGGQGLSLKHQVAWAQEAAAYTLPVAPFGLGMGLCLPTILAHGTEELKQRYVKPLLRGEEIWCQLYSEPGAGSDLAGVQTKAERHGDEWIVNGQKVWTSGAHYADFGAAVLRTDPDVPKHRGLTFLLVDMRQEGVEVRPLRQITGDAQFNEVFFTDARVPEGNVLGDVNDGWRVALTMLMHERMTLGGGGAGGGRQRRGSGLLSYAGKVGALADPARRDAVLQTYVTQRVLAMLGQRMREEAKSKPPGPEFSMMKIQGSRLAVRSSQLGVNVADAGGIAWEEDGSAPQRWTTAFLGSPGGMIAGGTDQVLLNVLGERVLGLPQEPRPDKNVAFRELKVGTVT